MSTTASHPVCSACGDRIGVYEPVWLELEDGTVTTSALLQIDWARTEPRLFHLSCLEVDVDG
jgi:hypothetical protein